MSYATPRPRRSPAQAYAQLGLETRVLSASPARLITLLFDGARAALANARRAMAAHDVAARGQAISKAIDIVTNGLKASLDDEAGGALAARLHQAYGLIVQKLLLANLKNDLAQLDGADRLLAEIGAAWRAATDPHETAAHETVLGQYEKIATLTSVMAAAAEAGDWAGALAFGQQYCSAVQALRGDDDAQPALTHEERASKQALLLRILANDAAMRDAVMPQLARLGTLLGGLRRQQTLRHAYGCASAPLP